MVFVVFENEKKLPLNELMLQLEEDGIKRNIPALHEKWKETRCFTKYGPFPLKNGLVEEGAPLEQWISETEWFVKDMQWLLGLEHFRFWSTMVHNPGAIESVVSFTQAAIPHYLVGVVRGTASVFPLYATALRCTLQVICRLVTQREAERCWMSREYLGELLYKHYLVSVPLLLELLPIYGCLENKPLLTHLLQTVFKLQPKYLLDLRVGLQYVQSTFMTIQRQIETDRIEGQVASSSTLNDLALYTLDCSTTLALLVELFPDVRTICADLGFEQSISNFYDNTLLLLYKNLYAMDNESSYLSYLNAARMELLSAFRGIVNLQLETVLEQSSLLAADRFLCVLTECLSDPVFVRDYQRHYPVDNDLDILKQAVRGVDNVKLEFVQNAYREEKENGGLTNGHGVEEEIPEDNESFGEAAGGFAPEEEQSKSGPSKPLTPEQQIEVSVREMLDVLPHLGDGFIRKVLARYDTVEQAIAAVLEGNLPPDLAEADSSEPYIPPDKTDRFFLETGIERLNIYDGDELDVLVHDKVKGVIKKGKGMPGQAKNLKQMLDDKSHVRELKDRYQEYQNVCDEYDDEYDDSYDAMADSESKKVRLSVEMRNALVDEVDDESEDEGEQVEPEEEQPAGRKPMDFCENPEVVRQRYEERRRSKQQARHGGGPPAGSGGGGSGGGQDRDVVGKPKGQGQDKNVVNNRKHKGENKASRANHNRKQGATFKRNKGMIPS